MQSECRIGGHAVVVQPGAADRLVAVSQAFAFRERSCRGKHQADEEARQDDRALSSPTVDIESGIEEVHGRLAARTFTSGHF